MFYETFGIFNEIPCFLQWYIPVNQALDFKTQYVRTTEFSPSAFLIKFAFQALKYSPILFLPTKLRVYISNRVLAS